MIAIDNAYGGLIDDFKRREELTALHVRHFFIIKYKKYLAGKYSTIINKRGERRRNTSLLLLSGNREKDPAVKMNHHEPDGLIISGVSCKYVSTLHFSNLAAKVPLDN